MNWLKKILDEARQALPGVIRSKVTRSVPSLPARIVTLGTPISIGIDVGAGEDMTAVAILPGGPHQAVADVRADGDRIGPFTPAMLAMERFAQAGAVLSGLLYEDDGDDVDRSFRDAMGDLYDLVPLSAQLLESENDAVIQLLRAVMPWANEKKLGAREKCRLLGIPWVARLVPRSECCEEMARVVRDLPPSTFAQTLPRGGSVRARDWADLVDDSGANAVWMAHNAADLVAAAGYAGANNVADYVGSQPKFPRSKSVAAVIRESREWHEGRPQLPSFWPPVPPVGARGGGREWPGTVEVHIRGGGGGGGSGFSDEMREEIRRHVTFEFQGDMRHRREPPVPDVVTYPFTSVFPIKQGSWELHLLTSREQFLEEGLAVWNCLRHGNYWRQAARKQTMIFSLRNGEHHAATIELNMGGIIRQFEGPRSKPPAGNAFNAGRDLVARFRRVLDEVCAMGPNRSSLRLCGGTNDGLILSSDAPCLRLPQMEAASARYTGAGEEMMEAPSVSLETYTKRTLFGGDLACWGLDTMSDADLETFITEQVFRKAAAA